MNFEELSTLLVEVETVVNSRPLTYVHDDQDGLSYALSPSHLIYGRRITNTPNSEHFEIISTHESLTRKAQHQKKLTNHWRRDYLLSLRENCSTKKKQREGVLTSVGDVVILRNESTKRMFWKLAKVEKLLPGIKHLIPPEVSASTNDEEQSAEKEDTTNNQPNQSRNRRQAAIKGELLRRINRV